MFLCCWLEWLSGYLWHRYIPCKSPHSLSPSHPSTVLIAIYFSFGSPEHLARMYDEFFLARPGKIRFFFVCPMNIHFRLHKLINVMVNQSRQHCCRSYSNVQSALLSTSRGHLAGFTVSIVSFFPPSWHNFFYFVYFISLLIETPGIRNDKCNRQI